MADEEWDVVVIGAGPAGAAAAIAARKARPAARVLLLDKAAFPRDKVCGDGIAPHALEVLRRLDVDTDEVVAGFAPIHRLRLVSPAGRAAARGLREPAWVIPRTVFDARLVRAAVARGAVLRQQTVRSIRPDGAGVRVDDRIRATTLIGADGAESTVRRGAGTTPAPSGTVALAVRGYADAGAWPAGEQLLCMTRRHWPAYAWAFPIGDGRANVGYGELLGSGAAPTRAHLVERLHALLPEAAPCALRGHRLPLSTGRPVIAAGPILLAGDAASLINPFTGEGIYYAVLSGALAGQAAADAVNGITVDPGRAYRRALRAELGRHLRQTDLIARLGRWPALVDAGVAAARDRQAGFDTLVDIGLGSGRLDARTLAGVARHLLTG